MPKSQASIRDYNARTANFRRPMRRRAMLLAATDVRSYRAAGDRRHLAEKRFLTIPVATDIKLENGRTGRDRRSGKVSSRSYTGREPRERCRRFAFVYEVLLLFTAEGQNCASVSGVIGAEGREAGLKDLQAMAHSFQRKSAAAD